jgi:hypothetical protein
MYAGGQLWMLSEMLRDPEWMKKDRTVILAVGAMYGLFLIALVCGQRKKRTDDRLFADGVRCEYINSASVLIYYQYLRLTIIGRDACANSASVLR